MKRKIRKSSAAVLTALMFLFINVTAAYAWYSSSKKSMEPDFTAYIHAHFFESGNGTSESPYEIARPIQLYYFSWLQNLGYFNKPDTNGNVEPVYFIMSKKNYNSIDMTGMSIPPIGTENNPFLGNFDGRGITIENLTVSTTISDFEKKPDSYESTDVENAQIVGFFGVIGSYTGNETVSSQLNTAGNFHLDNVTVKSKTPKSGKTLIGIAAGYVNAPISDISISNCNIELGTNLKPIDGQSNLSEYSVIGYCPEDIEKYLDTVTVEQIEAKEPNVEYTDSSQGSSAGDDWGGTVNIQEMYNRLSDIFDRADAPEYVSAETKRIAIDGKETITSSETSQSTDFLIYKDDCSSYSFSRNTPNSDDKSSINLFGETEIAMTKLVTVKSEGKVSGFKIADEEGHNYLSTDGNILINVTNQASAVTWNFSDPDNNRGYISSVVNGKTVYLGVYNFKYLSLNTMAQASWSIVNNSLCYAEKYYAYFSGGRWILYDTESKYSLIKSNNGDNYLSTDGTNIYNSTSRNTATRWEFSDTVDDNNKKTICTYINGTVYYLIDDNGTLAVSLTPTYWQTSIRGGIIFNNLNYISFSDNQWKFYDGEVKMGYTLSDMSEEHFVNVSMTPDGKISSSSNLPMGTSSDKATVWFYDSSTDIYYVSAKGYKDKLTNYCLMYFNNNGLDYKIYLAESTEHSYKIKGFYKIISVNSTDYLAVFHNVEEKYYYFKYGTNDYWDYTTEISEATPIKRTEKIGTTYDSAILNIVEDSTSSFPLSFDGLGASTGSYESQITEPSSFDTYPTYFPLSFQSDNAAPLDKNTGYVIGGISNYNSESTTNTGIGDVKVSKHPISAISNSFSDSTFKTIYTVNDSGSQAVSDSNTFTKYIKSRQNLMNIISNQSNIYSIVFSNTDISIDKTVTVPDAIINSTHYSNYKVPEGTIDFRLKETGYISLFAGTLSGGEHGFFSLNQILRDSDNNITEIKEISKVYFDAANNTYYYKYADNTWSSGYSANSNGTSVFDLDRISQTVSVTENALYYFEIPATSGEYAITSSNSSENAYLLYLDISAATQEIRTTITTEEIIKTTYDYLHPKGVQIVENTNFIDASDSAVLKLSTNCNGKYRYSRTGNNIIVTGNTTDLPVTGYKSERIIFTYNGFPLTATETARISSVTKKTTVDELNLTAGTHTVTVFTKIDDNDVTNTFTVYNIDRATLEDIGQAVSYGTRTSEEISQMNFDFESHYPITGDGSLIYRYVKPKGIDISNSFKYSCSKSIIPHTSEVVIGDKVYSATIISSNNLYIFVKKIIDDTIININSLTDVQADTLVEVAQ